MERHHIMITCGTSQMDKSKKGLWEYLHIEPLRKTNLLADTSDAIYTPESFLVEFAGELQTIVESLVAYKDILGTRVKREKWFGAEISTLQELKDHRHWKGWDPKQDTYVLLSSATCAGYFCAEILRRLLIHPDFWNVPKDNVGKMPVKVNGLIDTPDSEMGAENATRALCHKIYEHKIPGVYTGSGERRNVFVMTGGYKSSIPYLTIFSMIYDIEMIYLFERSPYVQSLFPKVTFKEREWET